VNQKSGDESAHRAPRNSPLTGCADDHHTLFGWKFG
jgi:hypothetical protein